jgi:hypothetical protein
MGPPRRLGTTGLAGPALQGPVLAACVLAALLASSSARACDPAGPPPATLPPAQAAAQLLYGRDETYTHVLHGEVVDVAEERGQVTVRVLKTFRGGLAGQVRTTVPSTSCHSIRPKRGLRAVFYGQASDSLSIVGSNYFDELPDSELLYPALVRAAVRRAPVEIRPWWRFW